MSTPPASFKTMQNHIDNPSTVSSINPTELAADISFHEHASIEALQTILRHPRSLARPTPHWRPPQKKLPGINGNPPLVAAITRHRVGARAKARIRGFGEKRTPAYLISLRITDPTGAAVEPGLAEAWTRALLPAQEIDAVHEIGTGYASTFLWLVDSDYQPVHSPISLFSGFSEAA
ncbi:Hypothetical protein NG00_00839 [Corynebacterium camporealensis]|uniref:Uncharacterized protein n=1 Tax=Corynebacterium camporealensis TaxID=161896 RepID=A0A0F6QVM2_9CORY|nr:hypothetical protein [Corynebacterium camporealensis]AKE38902.1 hypothetical protein UL81_04645 [Corynebacterium camporealensis]AVH88157.1 Hypothetical protein NG00_00839 [Corynebacterium camporealensis]